MNTWDYIKAKLELYWLVVNLLNMLNAEFIDEFDS